VRNPESLSRPTAGPIPPQGYHVPPRPSAGVGSAGALMMGIPPHPHQGPVRPGAPPHGFVPGMRPLAFPSQGMRREIQTPAPQQLLQPTVGVTARAPPPMFGDRAPSQQTPPPQPQQQQQKQQPPQPLGQFASDSNVRTRRVAPPAAHRTTMPSAQVHVQQAPPSTGAVAPAVDIRSPTPPSGAVASHTQQQAPVTHKRAGDAAHAAQSHAAASEEPLQTQNRSGNVQGNSDAPSFAAGGTIGGVPPAVAPAATVQIGSEFSSYLRAALRQQQQSAGQQNRNTWMSAEDPDDDDGVCPIIAPSIDSSPGPTAAHRAAPSNTADQVHALAAARALLGGEPRAPRPIRTVLAGASHKPDLSLLI
jgi:hypothetical protein